VEKIMRNDLPGIPRLSFPLVDVRDVAIAHYKALISPDSNGKRYILASNTIWAEEMLNILRNEFSKFGYKFTTRKIGKCPMKMASIFDSSIKVILPVVGLLFRVDNTRSIEELGMKYRKPDESLIDMAYNMIDLGLIPNKLVKSPKL